MINNNFVIPIDLELPQILSDKHPLKLNDLDYFYFIIDYLYEKHFLDKRYDSLSELGKFSKKKIYIPINFKYLRKLIPFQKIKPIKEILIKENIIESDGQYISGLKSKGYRLSVEFLTQFFKEIKIQNKILLKNLMKNKGYIENLSENIQIKTKEINQESSITINENHQRIRRVMIDEFLFDYTSSIEHLDSLSIWEDINRRQTISYSYNLERLNKNHYYLTTSTNIGRIFTNYTNLPKEFRKFISHKSGDELVEIDISNSQPYFLSLKCNEIVDGEDYEDIEDVKLFSELCQNGELYCYINSLSNKNISKEDIIKIMYSKNYKNSSWKRDVKKILKQYFPTVLQIMDFIKEKDHSTLPIDLQKLESEMIIDTISPILLNNNIDFIPIHDSFIVCKRDVDEVQKIFKNEFRKKYNSEPHLKMKPINE